MDISGENLTPGLRPSIESEMHLSIYRGNRTVRAIVHAHPVCASAFTAMKMKINTSLTAEARAILGDPCMVPYELMGTGELASRVAGYARKCDTLLLENHGILTTGATLLQAFDKIEVLENAAKMTLITEMTGKKSQLSEEKVLQLDRIFR